MKLLTGSQMAEVDRRTIEDYNIDGLILMENAGIGVYKKIKEIVNDWVKFNDSPFKNVVVVAGKGNNGGDGFVIARHLVLNGFTVTVFASAERSEYSDDALKNYLAFENFGDINIISDDTIEDLRDSVLDASIVVDALLGTGIKGNVEGSYADIIDIINESEGIVVAVDIPSGVVANTGDVGNVAVEADFTETFAVPKLGLVMYPGAEYVGELNVVDIGIPEFVLENTECKIKLTTDEYVFNHMPWRPNESHKGTYGKVLTIAGSKTMTGAGLLSANSVLKVGAGLSNLASPASIIPYYTGIYPELIYTPLRELNEGYIGSIAIEDLALVFDDYECVILGPGIGTNPGTIDFVKEILQLLLTQDTPVVIDADALNCVSKLSHIMFSDNIVMTPHPKELSRLLDVDVNDIINNRIEYVEAAQKKYGCNVILKGANSLIASKNEIFVNPTGNSALATAGSGDVLAGIIAGLVAQGLSVYEATVCASYIHGLAGDLASKNLTEYSVVATDVMNHISKAIYELSIL